MSVIDDWFGVALGNALDPDGHYGNQCVDAVDHYGEFIFGVPWSQSVGAVSGARQLLDAAPDAFWIRIDYYHGFIPQRGDVLVYGGDKSNTWGHTAVTEAATATVIDVAQQDGFGAPLKFVDGAWYSDKPAHRARLAYSQNGTGALKGVLRPRPEKLKSSTIRPQGSITITPFQEDEMSAEDVKTIRADIATVHQTVIDNQKGIRADVATVHNTIIRDVGGQLAGLREALRQVAAGEGATIDLAAIEAAAKRGAEDALAHGVVTVDVNVQGGRQDG
jgi:hypothetical protein